MVSMPKKQKKEGEEQKLSSARPPSSDDDDTSSSEDESDDEIILEGELRKVEDEDSEKSFDDEPETKRPKKEEKKIDDDGGNCSSDEDDVSPLKVEFTFNDASEKFFHGLKMHLHSNPVLAPYSSALADIAIENVSVGTIISTENDPDDNVFGFATVLNVTTYQKHDCIQELKAKCLKYCPDERKEEMKTVLSGKTNRPAGFLLHSRMVNIPLEITQALHQQLVLDMDWAVEHAEGGKEERKSHDFGVFILLAPCTRVNGSLIYKYFDDEIFSEHAEFTYEFNAPKSYGSEEEHVCSVIAFTKTGHRAAMEDLKKLIS